MNFVYVNVKLIFSPLCKFLFYLLFIIENDWVAMRRLKSSPAHSVFFFYDVCLLKEDHVTHHIHIYTYYIWICFIIKRNLKFWSSWLEIHYHHWLIYVFRFVWNIPLARDEHERNWARFIKQRANIEKDEAKQKRVYKLNLISLFEQFFPFIQLSSPFLA